MAPIEPPATGAHTALRRPPPKRPRPPAQETSAGYELPIARRSEFFALLGRVAVSGAPARARGRRAASPDAYALDDFAADFQDDSACLEWLWRRRHAPDGDHARCPACRRSRLFRRYATTQQRQAWTCTGCGHHLHPTAGTIFRKSSTTLDRWFYAIYLVSATGGRVTARQLERELGVTYKTAWRMRALVAAQLVD